MGAVKMKQPDFYFSIRRGEGHSIDLLLTLGAEFRNKNERALDAVGHLMVAAVTLEAPETLPWCSPSFVANQWDGRLRFTFEESEGHEKELEAFVNRFASKEGKIAAAEAIARVLR